MIITKLTSLEISGIVSGRAVSSKIAICLLSSSLAMGSLYRDEKNIWGTSVESQEVATGTGRWTQ